MASNSSYKWNEKFTRPRKIDETAENKPYMCFRDEIEGDEDVISFFMRESDQRDRCLLQTDIVPSFCAGVNVQDLQDGNGGPVLTPIAWLDERNFRGDKPACRPCANPLSARGLYEELSRERFSTTASSDPVSEQQHASRTSTGTRSDPLPDAERRLIYIADLTSYAVLALATTASDRQAPALSHAIRHHLSFDPVIKCEVDIDFALQFHLPYVAWRPSTTPRKDKRVGRDRKPLRNTTDVTFLTTSTERCADPKQRAYLYDAQISCLVAGEDHWRWEGYGLVDTYFEEDGVRKDMKYYESQDAPQYISPDPIPGGNHDFSKSLPPREYWLMALEKRLKQVVEEWQNVYQRIEQGVDEFTNDELPSPNDAKRPQRKELNRQLQKEWTNKTERLLRRLIRMLQKSVSRWKHFEEGEKGYFNDIEERAKPLLATLSSSFRVLEDLQDDFKHLLDCCNDFGSRLGRDLQLDGNNAANIQQKDAQQNKGLIIITTLIFYPPGLVAAMFSAQGVLPFPGTPASFLATTMVATVVVGVVVAATLFIWPWLRQATADLLELRPETLKPPDTSGQQQVRGRSWGSVERLIRRYTASTMGTGVDVEMNAISALDQPTT